jgi:hypothetical protein
VDRSESHHHGNPGLRDPGTGHQHPHTVGTGSVRLPRALSPEKPWRQRSYYRAWLTLRSTRPLAARTRASSRPLDVCLLVRKVAPAASWAACGNGTNPPEYHAAGRFNPPAHGTRPPFPIDLPKTRSKRHSCRVRRKRQRLRSNGSIGSDPAFSLALLLTPRRAGSPPNLPRTCSASPFANAQLNSRQAYNF